jgi:TRAP-type mannitol/chloroaromatic compound transport system permease large subunit
MYAGALIPGLVLTTLYMGYVFVMSLWRPEAMPALPPEARTLGSGVASLLVALAGGVAIAVAAHYWLGESQGANADILGATVGVVVVYVVALIDRALGIGLMSRLAQQVIIVLIPPLALIFLVLGTIFLGIATPTEGGAMGAVGALVLAAAKGRLTLNVVRQALAATTRLSAFVMFILIGARVFSLTFYGVNGHVWVEHLLTSLPGGELGFLVVVSVLVFLLAFFLDFFELAFIIVPLLAPAAAALGIDLIWFGVILGVNMQTSFMHPPFGFALFYLRGIAPKTVKSSEIYWGAIPWVVLQLIMVAIVIAFPELVTYFLDKGPSVDPSTIQIELPPSDFQTQEPPAFGTEPGAEGSAEPESGAEEGEEKPDDELPPPPDFK